jgi:hypothetical protein
MTGCGSEHTETRHGVSFIGWDQVPKTPEPASVRLTHESMAAFDSWNMA